MRRKTSTQLACIVCTAGLLLLGPAPFCHGGPLNFAFNPDGPIGLGINGSLSYDASTGELSGTALPLTLSSSTLPGGAGFVRFSGNPQLSFDLFVNPDGTFKKDTGGFNLSGTLSFGGTKISGTLLTGDFTAFGAQPAGPPTWVANALFGTSGGLLTQSIPLADGLTLPPQFPIGGPVVGVDFFVEHDTSGTHGDFTHSFSSNSIKTEFGPTSVPEPASAVLALLAVAVLSAFGLIKKWSASAS